MNVERSLQELVTQAEKFSKTLTQVRETSRKLGSDEGPKYLSYKSVSGLKSVYRIKRVGEIRSAISTKTIPYLEDKRAKNTLRIVSKVQEEAIAIRQLFKGRFINRQELNLASRELAKLGGRVRVRTIRHTEQAQAREEFDQQVKLLRIKQLSNQQISDQLDVPIFKVNVAAQRLIAKGEIERFRRAYPKLSQDYTQIDEAIKNLRTQGIKAVDIRQQLGLTVHQLGNRVSELIRRGEIQNLRKENKARVALEQALDRHLDANPNKPIVLAELGREIGVSTERIRQLYDEIATQRPVPFKKARKIEGPQEVFWQKAKELFSQGLSPKQVAQELHITVSLANKIKSSIYQLATQTRRKENETQVRELRQQGFGNKKISEMTGIKLPVVTKFLQNLFTKDQGLRLKRMRRNKEEAERFEEWVKQLRLDPRNLNIRQIAEITGEKKSVIGNYINKLIAKGIVPKRSQKRTKKTTRNPN